MARGAGSLEGNALGNWMIAGGVIAFIGYFIPGDYGVTYSPPVGNQRLNSIVLTSLPHFKGALTGSNSAVYSMHGGPVNWSLTLSGIIVLFLSGCLTRAGIGEASKVIRVIFKSAPSAYSMATSVAQFIWEFHDNFTPPPIRASFVKDLGGGELAVTASHYLNGNLGLGMVIVLVGLLTGLVGANPKLGCTAWVLFVLAVIALIVYAVVAGPSHQAG